MPNKPKILSNDLDQVPKKGEWYRQELLQPELAEQIADALTDPEDLPMGENDFFIGERTDKKVLDRFLKHSDKLPVEEIGKMLKDHSVVSCEISRVKKDKTGGWQVAVGPLVPGTDVFLGEILWRIPKEKVDGYDITFITFMKTAHAGWPTAKISLQKVGFPNRPAQNSGGKVDKVPQQKVGFFNKPVQNSGGKVDMIPNYGVFHHEVRGKEVDEISL